MSVLKSLRVLARYNILTPIAFLALIASPGVATAVELGPTDSSGSIELAAGEDLTNSGTITNDTTFAAAVYSTAAVGTIANNASGVIDGTTRPALLLLAGAISFSNSGAIRSNVDVQGAVQTQGTVETFTNTSTGSIANASPTGAGVFFTKKIGDFSNAGSISGSLSGVVADDNNANDVHEAFDNFTNLAGGKITGDTYGVFTTGNIGSFSNAGEITGGASSSIAFSATIDSFYNSGTITTTVQDGIRGTRIKDFVNDTTGVIVGSVNGLRLDVGAADNLDSFSNAGRISGGYEGVDITGNVGTFRNAVGAIIESTRTAPPGNASQMGVRVTTGHVGLFQNDGTIRSATDYGVAIEAAVDSFSNTQTGTIAGTAGAILNNVGSFYNAGSIVGTSYRGAYLTGADSVVTQFINDETGHISGIDAALFSGGVQTFLNAGVIHGNGTNGDNMRGVGITGAVGTFTNSGEISSDAGIAIRIVGEVDDLINSGTIRSGDGRAIVFNAMRLSDSVTLATDDKLTLLTGSKIFGSVAFGGGDDTLNFAGFAGNTVLDVFGLDVIEPGSRLYFETLDEDGGGQIAIVDVSGLNGQTIGKTLLDMLLTSNSLISGQLAHTSSAEAVPTAFAPSLDQPALNAVDTAVLSEVDTLQQRGVTVWGGAFGGSSADTTPVDSASLYGGILFGAHALVDETFTLGGTGGYVASTSQQGDDQTLATRTGLIGFYGQAALGVADIDFSLTAGASAHESTRLVVANNTTETATGLFTSAFIAPSASITVPVLSTEAGEFAIKASATYVAGATAGYTETGSSANLTVGSQTIGIADARIGLESRHALETMSLTSRAGIYVQANNGSASVSVAAAGFGGTQTITSPGTSAVGLYGGVGLEAEIGDGMALTANLDGALGNDGTGSVSFKLGLAGSF